MSTLEAPMEPSFKAYFELFKNEFNTEGYEMSEYNLKFPIKAKDKSDGSIFTTDARSLTLWNSIQTKCSHKSCKDKTSYQSPYQILNHYQSYHPKDLEGKLMSCPLCTPQSRFTLMEFQHHFVQEHYRHLSYW
jgi:hypothetical protein